MKVLDLQCQQAHSFEGWFGSEDDFQSQLAHGLVECPLCGDAHIIKKLSAPRLNLLASRHSRSDSALRAPNDSHPEHGGHSDGPLGQDTNLAATKDAALAPLFSAASLAKTHSAHRSNTPLRAMLQDPQFQAAYLHMARAVIAQTEDVGNQFAEEARKMHYGETNERAIRGQATQDEALELLDEGIDVMPLALPKALKESLQ